MYTYPISKKWNDRFNSAALFSNEFDHFLADWLGSSSKQGEAQAQAFTPACEILEGKDHFLLSLEVPGIRKEDLNLETSEGQLKISGVRKQETVSDDGQIYSERKFGSFERVFHLPNGVEAERIEASYQDGILQVRVPKAETAKPKQVKILDKLAS